MREFTQRFFKYITLLVFIVFVWFAVVYSALQNSQLPAAAQVDAPNNITTSLSFRHGAAIRKSRESVVRIVSMSDTIGSFATTSGTYVAYKNKYYILTVDHGIMGSCEKVMILTAEGLHSCLRFAARDMVSDYAVIEVDPLPGRKPISIPRDIPHGKRWLTNLSALTEVFYTGFPNAVGPLTINGHIAGYSGEDYIYLHSYAWAGASGSGVFNENGKLIGYVMAVNVGYTEYGYDVIEDIVIVVPVFSVNWEEVDQQSNQEQANVENDEP
tara:strand:+ start:658 stop:1467 length:810 start_codon:yes stop_codon:yes gene_type:complete